METVELQVYDVTELNEDAQQKAFVDWQSESDYLWHGDNMAVLKEFENIFPVKVKDFQYGGGRGDKIKWKYTGYDDILELTGIRLLKWLVNNHWDDLFIGKYYGKLVETFPNGEQIPKNQQHPAGYRHVKKYSKVLFEPRILTGYYIGENITEPLRDFLRKPDNRNLEDLLGECLETWLQSCNKDVEEYFSWESFVDMCKVNEWKYLPSGKFFG